MEDNIDQSRCHRMAKWLEIQVPCAPSRQHNCVNDHRINDENSSPESHETHDDDNQRRVFKIDFMDIGEIIYR